MFLYSATEILTMLFVHEETTVHQFVQFILKYFLFVITVLGPNRFGKDGSLRCDSGLLPDTTSCEGLLFCLPDPFGCICGAGYKGIDCNTGTVGGL